MRPDWPTGDAKRAQSLVAQWKSTTPGTPFGGRRWSMPVRIRPRERGPRGGGPGVQFGGSHRVMITPLPEGKSPMAPHRPRVGQGHTTTHGLVLDARWSGRTPRDAPSWSGVQSPGSPRHPPQTHNHLEVTHPRSGQVAHSGTQSGSDDPGSAMMPLTRHDRALERTPTDMSPRRRKGRDVPPDVLQQLEEAQASLEERALSEIARHKERAEAEDIEMKIKIYLETERTGISYALIGERIGKSPQTVMRYRNEGEEAHKRRSQDSQRPGEPDQNGGRSS